jgi:hypothetical protein
MVDRTASPLMFVMLSSCATLIMMLSRTNAIDVIQREVFCRSNQTVMPKRLFLVFEHSVLSYSSADPHKTGRARARHHGYDALSQKPASIGKLGR